jgi:tetratricopeptide (TPR) repeat protein
MKKIAMLLVLCMTLMFFNGCVLKIPSISEARNVIDGYLYYRKTGELPSDIAGILGESLGLNTQTGDFEEIAPDLSGVTLENTLVAATKSEILELARQYYERAYPLIESDTRSEYKRLITWEPDFRGKQASKEDVELQKSSSVNVVLALSYTSAKNFYLAMAASVFALNPDDTTSAGNFAAALASYGDDLKEESSPSVAIQKYYDDAVKVYHYALMIEGKNGKHTQKDLPLLVSLGNLYLDSGKYNEAYTCFQTVLEIDGEYSAAVEGLYNTYMALKQYKKALDLIAKTTKYPALIGATAKVGEKKQEDEKKPGMKDTSIDEDALEVKCDSLSTTDAISTVDFLDAIDVEAKEKLDKLIRQVQGKMVYTAPDIKMISQYGSLKGISEPLGQATLEAFGAGADQIREEALLANEKLDARFPSDKAIDEAEAGMRKYQINQNSDIETVEKFFAALSKILPEYAIYSINPYDYANPVDIIIQRYNIEYFTKKFSTYYKYLIMVNRRVEVNVTEIMDMCDIKVTALVEEMYDKIAKIDPEDKNYLAKVHNVHLAYYPKINGLKQVYWNQATSITVTAYQQKIKKYLEQMYNGCMKHLILISDDKIQTYLEEKLQAALLSSMEAILNQLYLSFSFVTYDDDCKCDFGAMEQERRKNEEEQNRLANEQIKRNMEAKKRFESGDLDENSDYYKKFIKPYEVHFSSPFVKGVIGPYKTTMHIKIQLLKNHKVLEFKQVEHHIRNTTTYNGGIEIGAGVKAGSYEIGPRAYLKFTATKGSDGQFAMDDVDITGGGNVTFKSMFTEAQAGMEASAVRGTKTYANFSVSGEKLINSDFRKSMGFWFPKLKKEIWRGEYPVY